MNNIRQFKNLIKKYESITLEKLTNPRLEWMGSKTIMNYLTGFGNTDTCRLCIRAGELSMERYGNKLGMCIFCVWVIATGDVCYGGNNEKTYEAIKKARNRVKLLEAVKQRAEYMKTVLEEYERMNEKTN